MNILVITGDRNFKAGNQRFDLQAGAVESMEALYWGPRALWGSPQGESFDVVSTQDPFFRGLVGLFWAWRFRARLNVQVHADLDAQSVLKRILARFVLSRADSVRVVSEKLKAQVEKLGVRASVAVLPIYIDLERFKVAKRAPSDVPTILWVGRFEEEKDPFLAIRVFNEVQKEVPNAALVMLGAGSLEVRLRKEAAGLRVEFPGWHDPVPYLARAHVVLSTSRAESYGASIVEALAAGVPVVAPDVGIAREAGAIIAKPARFVATLIEMLRTPTNGELKLPLLTRDEWVTAWKKTL